MRGFKNGQKVVCIKRDKWRIVEGPNKLHEGFGPRFNEIVTVDGYMDHETLYLKEYKTYHDGCHAGFTEWNFEPLADITEIEEILTAELIEV